ncbi:MULTISPECIES: cysteine hydrolase family protein [Alteribacter]|uniref:Cysteine hydrolase n=1 Tax=Alteribacter keqinensis TaxID=2483800 RepID=A0A3M7TWN5_9BACI|nr:MULTISPECIES: isochorismatase family cysteine hydrolase [Alteribacter]MBM7094598.1 cysteine hydrolase [Alteribacter salitolerans]RNA69194.1 cysteine hydrolase [Alteribacter keqinensis]
MRALIVIDYTYDFVADEGRLTCGRPGQSIENRITSLTEQYLTNGDLVVMAVDVHDENDTLHPENKLFPPHNIRGTKGRKLYGQLGEMYDRLIKNENHNLMWMDKTRYSAFTGTDLDLKLGERAIKEVHLAGVCTDICVLHTAVDAYNKGFRIVIHQDAVQSFNQAGHEWALGHFKNVLGAEVLENSQPVNE